jgi:hypothetical protein
MLGKKIMVMVTYVTCLAVLTSCSTTQYGKFTHQLPLPENSARIYIVRPSILAYAIPMHVKIDEKIVGTTGARGYICYDIPAGEHIIKSKAENSTYFGINAQAGETYYFKQKPTGGWLYARNKLENISKESGQKTVTKLKKPRVNYVE